MKRHLPPEMCDTPDDYYSQFEQKPEEDYEPEELQAEIEYIQHNPLPF